MSRRSLVLAVAALAALTGCQSKSAQTTTRPSAHAAAKSAELRATSASSSNAPIREYEAVPAAALVFDPPVIANEAPLELSRADREPRVSLGYEGPIVETYYIRFDDRQIGYGGINGGGSSGRGGRYGGTGNFDMYERRAITERSGVRYR